MNVQVDSIAAHNEHLEAIIDVRENGYQRLTDESERVIALLFILVSQALPYFKLAPANLDKEEFRERRESFGTALDEVRHIALRDFDQTTKEAFALLGVVEQQEEIEDRAVLIAAYILMHQ